MYRELLSEGAYDSAAEYAQLLAFAKAEFEKEAAEEEYKCEITEEINTPNRGTCDYAIVDNIEEITNDYKALDKDDSIEDLEI